MRTACSSCFQLVTIAKCDASTKVYLQQFRNTRGPHSSFWAPPQQLQSTVFEPNTRGSERCNGGAVFTGVCFKATQDPRRLIRLLRQATTYLDC